MEYVLDPSDFQEVLSDRREAHARLKNLRNLACKVPNQGNLFTFGGVFRDINTHTTHWDSLAS